MKTIEWFKKLLKEIPKDAPADIELFYVAIKMDEFDYHNFAMEVQKHAENNGGITHTYSPNSNQDSIEIQIGRTYFTVYKKLYREDPFRYRGKSYEVTE